MNVIKQPNYQLKIYQLLLSALFLFEKFTTDLIESMKQFMYETDQSIQFYRLQNIYIIPADCSYSKSKCAILAA